MVPVDGQQRPVHFLACFHPGTPNLLHVFLLRQPTGTLFKLQQTDTVAQYLSDFEDLANRIVGLTPQFLMSCFILGLTLDICRKVQTLQPLTLVQAVGLARLQEEKLLDTRPPFRNRAPPILPVPQPRPTPSLALLSPPIPRLPPPRPPPTLKHMSPEEIISRRERGLCFNCDEKYHRGHRCASRVFFLVTEKDEAIDPNIEGLDPGPEPPDIHVSVLA